MSVPDSSSTISSRSFGDYVAECLAKATRLDDRYVIEHVAHWARLFAKNNDIFGQKLGQSFARNKAGETVRLVIEAYRLHTGKDPYEEARRKRGCGPLQATEAYASQMKQSHEALTA